jgi:hypothetical protein
MSLHVWGAALHAPAWQHALLGQSAEVVHPELELELVALDTVLVLVLDVVLVLDAMLVLDVVLVLDAMLVLDVVPAPPVPPAPVVPAAVPPIPVEPR